MPSKVSPGGGALCGWRRVGEVFDLPPAMKAATLLLSCLLCCFGVSLPAATLASPPAAPADLLTLDGQRPAAWPGSNKRARRITKRARKRTFGITKISAFKVMKRRKARRKKMRRSGSRDKAAKGVLPVKKVGCPG